MSCKISFFHLKTNRMKMAVTPAPDSLIFPNPDEWVFDFSQMAHLEQTTEGCVLRNWEESFRRDGYVMAT
jgi:hypothetical protein